jgi:hypothetical protein
MMMIARIATVNSATTICMKNDRVTFNHNRTRGHFAYVCDYDDDYEDDYDDDYEDVCEDDYDADSIMKMFVKMIMKMIMIRLCR